MCDHEHTMFTILIQSTATACAVMSNTLLTIRLCNNPEAPVSRVILFLQMSASLGWIVFSVAVSNYFLLSTACTNLGLFLSCFTYITKRKQTNKIQEIDSESELPRFPLQTT